MHSLLNYNPYCRSFKYGSASLVNNAADFTLTSNICVSTTIRPIKIIMNLPYPKQLLESAIMTCYEMRQTETLAYTWLCSLHQYLDQMLDWMLH